MNILSPSPSVPFPERGGVHRHYLEYLGIVERLHRLLLDVVKDEFERLGLIDINSVQGLLLFNIADSELTAGELKSRGYYQGSNVSYNLKKLVQGGYINHQKCAVDRRAVRIRLTEKGLNIQRVVAKLFEKQADSLSKSGQVSSADIVQTNRTMRDFERFWSDQIRFIY